MRKGFTLFELLAVIVLLGIITAIATPIIFNVIEDGKKAALESTIDNIERASYTYITEENLGYEEYYQKITLEELANSGYLKDFDNKNPVTGNTLEGCIIYRWNGNKYEYNYVEPCEVPLMPGPLINILKSQYVEGATIGLVKDESNPNLYYYKGTNEEVANNHLWYGGHHWRVIEFDTEANTITLISQQPLTAIQPASTVWTTEEEYNSSYINSWLNEYFWNSLDSSIQNNILDNTFNIGIHNNVSEITTIKKVGLLDAEQYLRASGADSFLDIKNIFWLGNRYSLSYIRNVGSVGSLDYRHLSSSSGLRPVIKISNIIIAEGDGTLVNGFQISKKSTNTSNVQVGEYINVPYSGSNNTCGEDNLCTFRVVAKDNNSIKVVLNGLLSTNSAWADNAEDNITTNDLIYTNVLNGFIENIDSEYITIGEYGVEAYQSRDDYTVPQKTTITANVGLPTIGEIFSGNDINLGTTSTKLFVDVNTIENPKKTGFYWTMNKGSVNKVGESILPTVQFVHNFGELNNVTNSLTERGVRPVIFLKNNLTFTGGDGTAQNPYTVN